MKKRLTFILVFSSFLSFGQEYAWWFTSKKFLRNTPSREGYKYIYRVAANDNEGTRITVGSVSEPSFKYYRIAKSLLPITVNGYTLISDTNGTCSFNKSMDINKFEYLLGGNISSVGLTSPAPDYIECIDKLTKDVDELLRFHFYSIVLPHYVQPADNVRAVEDKLFKTTENTFSEAVVQVSAISWQYDYNDQGYAQFPEEIKHNFPMNATVGEILKNEVIERNKPLKIKVVLDTSVYGFGGKVLPIVESDVLSFNLIPSSPQLSGEIDGVKTTCNYDSDGSFVLNLKRDLYPNEKLAVIVYQQNTLSGEFDIVIDQNLDITSLHKINDTTYQFVWTNTLPVGTYSLKYQSGEKGESISPDDISWSSLVETKFTIEETTGVEYLISATSDQNCFLQNDGYIDVSADGESGRAYLYQLKREGIVQFFNGTSWSNYTGTNEETDTWFAFANAKTTRIDKLNKGKYQVKVKDSQGCFAR